MELLKSKKLKLPVLYFISDKSEIKELPIGVPFIYADEKTKPFLIRILEYEVLYKKAMESGLPFNFKQILKDNGYKGLQEFGYRNPAYIDYKTSSDFDIDKTITIDTLEGITVDNPMFREYINDSAVYVDIVKLKQLNVFPIWLDKIEKSIHANIHNFAIFNPNMYNKKLEGMYGGLDLVSPNRNLIIIDISGSIPKGVSSTCLALAKNLAETFYADILITGTISTLYHYENLHTLDINTIYEINGTNNDQKYFKALLESKEKVYKTAIVFGDNHHPGDSWQGSSCISDNKGKELCKWKVDKIISFHTDSKTKIAGYARWFECTNIEHIIDWVKYLR